MSVNDRINRIAEPLVGWYRGRPTVFVYSSVLQFSVGPADGLGVALCQMLLLPDFLAE